MSKELQLDKEFIVSMTAGAYLANAFTNETVPEDWTGTEECGDLAFAINKYMDDNKICYLGIMDTDNATKKVFADIMAGAEPPKRPYHSGYDVFARGFLAGQILGAPSFESLELAKKAEKMWDEDSNRTNPKYGYYQEILNEIVDDVTEEVKA